MQFPEENLNFSILDGLAIRNANWGDSRESIRRKKKKTILQCRWGDLFGFGVVPENGVVVQGCGGGLKVQVWVAGMVVGRRLPFKPTSGTFR